MPDTENKNWYFVKEPTEMKIKAELKGRFTAEDLRIIADKLDAHNMRPGT